MKINISGRDQFFTLSRDYAGLAAEERYLVQRTGELRGKIDRVSDPVFKKFYGGHLDQIRPKLDAVQARMAAIVAKVQQLQADDATVPNCLDDLDPGLPSMRVRLHDTRECLKHLRTPPPTPFAGDGRERLMRQLEEEDGYHVLEIRRRESQLLAALENEEEVRG